MALDVTRRISINVRSQNGKALAHDFRSPPRHGTLREATDIDARPSSQESDTGENTHGDEASAKDLGLDARHRHENYVARDRKAKAKHQEGSLYVCAVGCGVDDEEGDEGAGVRYDGEELGPGFANQDGQSQER